MWLGTHAQTLERFLGARHRRGALAALLLAACGGGTPTSAAPFQYPPELAVAVAEATPLIRVRYPDCTLAGWTLRGVPAPFVPPRGAACGASRCRDGVLVRGMTDYRARRITVWRDDPVLVVLIAWEGCNACRGPGSDRGCT